MTAPPSQSQAIERAILSRDPEAGRRVMLYGSKALIAGQTAITLIATIRNPHLIIAIQFRGGQTPVSDVVTDFLLSSDPFTDTGAPGRDTHISGIQTPTGGLSVSTSPIRIPVGWRINRSITYYKHLAINPTVNPQTVQSILELQLRGAQP